MVRIYSILIAFCVSLIIVPAVSNAKDEVEKVKITTTKYRTLECEVQEGTSGEIGRILTSCQSISNPLVPPGAVKETSKPSETVRCDVEDGAFSNCEVVPRFRHPPADVPGYSGTAEPKCEVRPGEGIGNCTIKDKFRHPKEDLYWFETLLLRGAKFSISGGRTNENGFTSNGVAVPLRFDSAIDTWGISVGYFGKKVLTDIMGAFDPALLRIDNGVWWRELGVDAVTMDLQYNYGKTAKRLLNEDPNLGKRSAWKVQLKYELPLESAWAHLRRGGKRLH